MRTGPFEVELPADGAWLSDAAMRWAAERVWALAGGREDFDPWANSPDYSQLYQPHRSGQHYTVWLPGRLDAAVSETEAALDAFLKELS